MKIDRELLELSSCTGKVAFDTFEQGMEVVERSRHGMHSHRRDIYKCMICQKWHIGRLHSQDRTKNKRRKQRRDEKDILDYEDY